MSPDPDGLGPVLEYLKSNRGFDFTGYKPASIGRRLAKRLEVTGSEDYAAYLDHLQVHPEEFELLFNTILINVTSFFRDPEAWDALRDDVLPSLLEGKAAGEPIRVWCAGCASGEEAYSIAILLCEALGDRAFRERVKIYGTDVDEEALDQARQGIYDTAQIEAVPDDLRSRYFSKADGRHAFRKDLRRALIFGRNDLVQDAPISRIDLLTCRNTLMYFNAETQNRVLRRFHFGLRAQGILFLGKSEMLLSRGELFRAVNLRRRIFAPVAAPRAATQRPLVPQIGERGGEVEEVVAAAFEASPLAQIVVDRSRALTFANAAARELLEVPSGDLGRPFQDLRVSYQPVELRPALDVVFAGEGPVEAGSVAVGASGHERLVEVRASPVLAEGTVVAAIVQFADVTELRAAEEELDRHKSELSAAYEELQSTIEELETTNEELQSTNEELETTNEELQSTNEELETMNEELQSSNEELETTNEELRARSVELNDANSFMDTILTGMGVGVIVVDQEQRVRIWNGQSEELWGARRGEVIGEHFMGLDIGLPVDELRTPLRKALAEGERGESQRVDATDRRGRTFSCELTVVPLASEGEQPTGAIVLARRSDEPVIA